MAAFRLKSCRSDAGPSSRRQRFRRTPDKHARCRDFAPSGPRQRIKVVEPSKSISTSKSDAEGAAFFVWHNDRPAYDEVHWKPGEASRVGARWHAAMIMIGDEACSAIQVVTISHIREDLAGDNGGEPILPADLHNAA